jgi:hypothetical protein
MPYVEKGGRRRERRGRERDKEMQLSKKVGKAGTRREARGSYQGAKI